MIGSRPCHDESMGQHKIAPGNAKDLLAPAKFDVEFQPPPPPSSSSIFFGALRPRPGPPAAAFDLPPSRFDPRDNFGFPVFGPMAQVQFRPLRPVDAFNFPFRPPDEGLESFPFAVRPNFFFEKPGPVVIRPKAPNGLEAPDNREGFFSCSVSSHTSSSNPSRKRPFFSPFRIQFWWSREVPVSVQLLGQIRSSCGRSQQP